MNDWVRGKKAIGVNGLKSVGKIIAGFWWEKLGWTQGNGVSKLS